MNARGQRTGRVAALLGAALLAITLAGCTQTVSSGRSSEAIEVDAGFGTAPTVGIPAPLDVDGLQLSVVHRGEGERITDGTTVSLHARVFDTQTGETITPAGAWADAELIRPQDAEPGIARTVPGLPGGSRIVVTGTARDFYGSERLEQVRLDGGRELAVVMDVSVPPRTPRATGELPADAMPAVTLDGGRPTAIAPGAGDPPATTTVRVLSAGAGATVTADDAVVFRAYTAAWGDGARLGDDFTTGAVVHPIADLPAGFARALTEQRVGSLVEAVIPPGEGPADRLPEALRQETLVVVIAIDGVSLAG